MSETKYAHLLFIKIPQINPCKNTNKTRAFIKNSVIRYFILRLVSLWQIKARNFVSRKYVWYKKVIQSSSSDDLKTSIFLIDFKLYLFDFKMKVGCRHLTVVVAWPALTVLEHFALWSLMKAHLSFGTPNESRIKSSVFREVTV